MDETRASTRRRDCRTVAFKPLVREFRKFKLPAQQAIFFIFFLESISQRRRSTNSTDRARVCMHVGAERSGASGERSSFKVSSTREFARTAS